MKGPNSLYILFEEIVGQYPNDICIIFGEDRLTYLEASKQIIQISNTIIKEAGEEAFIGVPTTRCTEEILFVLAILRAGKAYVPIDFKYPKKRLTSIINNSGLTFCLTTEVDKEAVEKEGLVPIKVPKNIVGDTSINYQNSYDLPTYVLYTSGSTGEPKGVCMGEKAMINLLNWQRKNSICNEGTRTLQFAPLSFDVSFQEILATLTTGGTLVLITEDMRLDMMALLEQINRYEVNRLFLPFVALQALAETAVSTGLFPKSLKEIMTAGEQLKITDQVRTFFAKLDNCSLYNQYGPTECHVVTQLKLEGNPNTWDPLPSIGSPIDNTSIYIVDENLNPLPNGGLGELCIAGDCLAQGYLNNQQLTEEKFVSWNSPNGEEIRLYRTGDIAKYLPDGNIEFQGRKDDQVKISGHRIELAEVEIALNTISGVLQTVVVASDHLAGQTQLVAYLQPQKEALDVNEIRQKVTTLLPEYMHPSHYVVVDNFAKTSSGKIDKRSLPKPQYSRPNSAPPYKKPSSKLEKQLASIWESLLNVPKIGIDDNFFELGGTSLLAQKLVAQLLKEHNLRLPVTKLYQFPTIANISDYLEPKNKNVKMAFAKQSKKKNDSRDIAIIGMAGRFPGAKSVDELWKILREGKETISHFTKEELDSSIPEKIKNDPLYVGSRGILPSAKEFDALFFGLNPKVASAMDPQQRILMEISWEVLEQTGYLPDHHEGTVGVYAGCGHNTYYTHNVMPNKELIEQVGEFQASTVNEKDYIATRIAYHLNLKGPAISIHSACSTSLLAIAEATEALRNGQCDIAIAGAASVTSPMNSGHLYQEGSIKTPDGHCRPFDANAKGTVFSDGAGVVLLKRLDQAKKDGDYVYGVIKGVGINNDGGDKGSFTAPSAEGQANAIMRAHFDAGVDPSEISYIEAHGTATPVGDPIEIEGLEIAFGEQSEKNFCAIGSIKSNMGHLTSAAGVAGVIKTLLAFKHEEIPASLGFSSPNPLIDFENNAFFVNSELRKWESKAPRKAGVSSFGVGGTNVHVVLEEYKNKERPKSKGRPVEILIWSAKSKNSLASYQKDLGEHLVSNKDIPLLDTAYSLTATRKAFNHRSFLVTDGSPKAKELLLSEGSKGIKSNILRSVTDELGFLFPGQGSQYLNMGKALYENEGVFRKAVDYCAEEIKELLHLDIRDIIFPGLITPEAEEKLKDTQYTQPALFIIEYALAQLWQSWSIKPTFVCGHSIGEFVAAHLAGVFSLPDALRLITLRGKLVSGLPGGSMLSIRTAAEEIMPLLTDDLSMAAINSDNLCVVSGPDEAIERFSKKLKEEGIANMLLATSHAFHSAMMNPILDTFEKEVQKMELNAPRIPIISTATGKWMSKEEATNPTYWTNHLRDAVKFSQALDTIIELDENTVLLEVGPGRSLSTLARQKKAGKSITPISSLTAPKDQEDSYHTILTALGELWINGHEPDWNLFYKEHDQHKICLPSYSFDRKPCWVETPQIEQQQENFHFTNNTPPTYDRVDIPINIKTFHESGTNEIPSIMRKDIILQKISEIISNISGIELEQEDNQYNFLELGLDSLVLTQMATTCKKEFETDITFRQLNDELNSPQLLAAYLDTKLPKDRFAPEITPPQGEVKASNTIHQNHQSNVPTYTPPAINQNYSTGNTNNSALGLIAQQLQLLGQQIDLIQNNGQVPISNVTDSHKMQAPMAAKSTSSNKKENISAPGNTNSNEDDLTEEEKKELKKPFGASPRIEKQSAGVNMEQEIYLKKLTERYNKKTASSKAYAQQHRPYMSDPRVVTGFKPTTKEMVYPLVVEKSSGNRLWDIDGNQYIDALNGFGSCMFGHQPDFIKKVLHEQIELGYEVGPQHPLAGEVCELLCEFTGQDRAALCNTGSEAVLGAIRIARTVTGRSLIVSFSGAYHGINDEALVRGSKKLKTFPAAAGILADSVQNVLVLEYGTPESLQIIKERAHELAAVVVEPVQSRRPEFRPVEFLKEVRKITEQSESVLIFDEVITGFRMHPGGAQALFGIKADLGTYGKVIGGGISIGAIIGKRKYMDALDGGHWQYGDNSYPEIGVTYFAGTFVRHPLALAAAKASLLHMKEKGNTLQEGLNKMTESFVKEVNQEFEKRSLPIEIMYFGSLWRLKFLEDIPYSDLLFVLMREKGIHIWDGFPCFMTSAFVKEDIQKIKDAFVESVDELISIGIFRGIEPKEKNVMQENVNSVNIDKTDIQSLNTPPVQGAKLGLDDSGNPAWFVPDAKKEGAFVKIDF
ncbi:polyketide synthase [Maribacter aurantiacus]|uniref:Amino acid adenylation domain-containing protein n=1 Tax=Maribacter aurantiacus TaxID=1882343 RepID=A0A5R8LY78_9FLAO|nr:polyketide synthase [Maribacter aurantiacus]TLF42286.1 amino acid adenylation domain-containing protein [Maribacter aurantiacus]